ncbi:uncharacterized protein DS421_12g359540 [Arachis hypogaea]|nr:uncharacterized protein DS421_12g359540 [Arachis hypogaea]
MILGLWKEHPLSLRDIIIDEHTTRNAIVNMAGGLGAIITMKRRLASGSNLPTNPSRSDKVSSSAIMSNVLLLENLIKDLKSMT